MVNLKPMRTYSSAKEQRLRPFIKDNAYFTKRLQDVVGPNPLKTGFYFVVSIVDLIVNNELKVKSFSKEIYPIIAEKYNVNVSCIERDIRTLIEKSWGPRMQLILCPYGLPNKRPTCREFFDAFVKFIKEDFI